MPRNNKLNQNALVRLAKLSVVRSACVCVSEFYADAKSRHAGVKSACDEVESRMKTLNQVAYGGISPLIDKLEPQVSIVNDIACKGLDWMETAFPVLQKPTHQIVASAKNKMHEVKDMASIVSNGTMDCVQHTITWVTGKMQVDLSDPVNEMTTSHTVSVTSVGVDSVLSIAEALVAQLLPLTNYTYLEQEAKALEVAAVGTSCHVRVATLTAKLYRRTCHKVGAQMHVKVCSEETRGFRAKRGGVVRSISWSPGLVQQMQTSGLTFAWGLLSLPQHIQHQALSVYFFISQVYNLCCQMHEKRRRKCKVSLDSALASNNSSSTSHLGPFTSETCPVLEVAVSSRRRKKPKITPFDQCNAKNEHP
ncbi:perilipin-2-like [Lampris incognitus]|uniref:perilipin-2-like n=1 Tax=Lampris incognitus TaxID=2546036 RepID=UPI0024B5B552|nr:perilipin-2-like [Lampris incognitus]